MKQLLAYLFPLFEKTCQIPVLNGAIPKKEYTLSWFETSTGKWKKTE